MLVRLVSVLTFVGVLMTGAVVAKAQPLIDRVPSEALLYAGWQGTTAMGEAYEQSNLHGVIRDAKLSDIAGRIFELAAQQQVKEGGDRQGIDLTRKLAELLWRHPWAMYVDHIQFPPADSHDAPQARFVLLVEAGEENAQVMEHLQAMIALEPEDTTRRLQTIGDTVVFATYCDEEHFNQLAQPRPQPLSTHARFQSAMKQVRAGNALIAYADAEQLLALAQAALEAEEDTKGLETFHYVTKTIGLGSIKRVLYTASFEQKQWASSLFVESPAPRAGLATLMDAQPVTPELLKLVPLNATWFFAMRFDVAAAAGNIRQAMVEKPDALLQFNQAIERANAFVGLDLETDLIQLLDDQWLLYSDAMIAGPQGMGLVIVNQSRDPAKLEQALLKLEELANRTIRQMAGQEPGRPVPQFTLTEQNGVAVHHMSLPFVSPSWTVHQGRLYIAAYAHGLLAAAKAHEQPGQSILDHPAYVGTMKMLGEHQGIRISYADLTRTAPNIHQLMALVAGNVPGLQGPNMGMLLPPLVTIMPHLGPEGTLSWVDASGYHSESITPFPGATTFNPSNAYTSPWSFGLSAGTLLPALSAARHTSRRMANGTQMRGIGQGLALHASENNHDLPLDLGTLLDSVDVDPKLFLNPQIGKRLPADFGQWPADQKAQWINANSDFIYIPKAKWETRADIILLIAKPTNDMGTNVVFEDNHVQFMSLDELDELITQQTGKPLKQWLNDPNPGQPQVGPAWH